MDGTRVTTDLTPKKPDPEWVGTFLEHYRKCGVVAWSAERAGICRQEVYWYRKHHPDFAARFKAARKESTEWIEAAAVKGAIEDANPTLIIFLLKSRKPSVYRDNAKVVVAGDANNPLRHEHDGTPALKARIEQLTRLFGSIPDGPEVGAGDGDGPGEPVGAGGG